MVLRGKPLYYRGVSSALPFIQEPDLLAGGLCRTVTKHRLTNRRVIIAREAPVDVVGERRGRLCGHAVAVHARVYFIAVALRFSA